MKLVVGLGNPGKKYQNTRHNLGFMVLDSMFKNGWKNEKKIQSEIRKFQDLIYAKPQTFMNESGLAVLKILDFYHLSPDDLIIIHDDLDLPLGKIRIQNGSSSAGHKGVSSIIEALKTEDFIRVRIGINRPKEGREDPEKYVLKDFSNDEKLRLLEVIKQVSQALKHLLEFGLLEAQNKYN